MKKGVVIWFTGYPNAGKSTISRKVNQRLKSAGYPVERIDSDEAPRSLTKDLSSDWRKRQFQKCANLTFISHILYKHGFIVLLSSVGRFRELRKSARQQIEDFLEVYLKCPLEIRLERDIDHGKYEQHAATIHYYEEPEAPELIIETDRCSADEAADAVIRLLYERGYIQSEA